MPSLCDARDQTCACQIVSLPHELSVHPSPAFHVDLVHSLWDSYYFVDGRFEQSPPTMGIMFFFSLFFLMCQIDTTTEVSTAQNHTMSQNQMTPRISSGVFIYATLYSI